MRRIAGGALLLVLVGLGVAVAARALAPVGTSGVVAPGGATTASDSGPDTVGALVYVHILGEVVAPGLYALRPGDRAVDAVAAAGGFTPDADQAALNLARLLADGEQLVVPARGAAGAGASADPRIDLNAADAAALDTLPGIGPATAAKILAWREQNGRFASVDDLLAVGGIGAAKLDALRDLVRV